MHRYMAESAQKKTGFRQLLNIDKESIRNEMNKSTLSNEDIRDSDEKMRASFLRTNPRNKNITGAPEF